MKLCTLFFLPVKTQTGTGVAITDSRRQGRAHCEGMKSPVMSPKDEVAKGKGHVAPSSSDTISYDTALTP